MLQKRFCQIVIATKLNAENSTLVLVAFNFTYSQISLIYIERMQHTNVVQNVI